MKIQLHFWILNRSSFAKVIIKHQVGGGLRFWVAAQPPLRPGGTGKSGLPKFWCCRTSNALFLSGPPSLQHLDPPWSDPLHCWTKSSNHGSTEKARPDTNGPRKTRCLTLQDLTMADQIAVVENAGPDTVGPNRRCGESRTWQWGSRSHGWKMKDLTLLGQILLI